MSSDFRVGIDGLQFRSFVARFGAGSAKLAADNLRDAEFEKRFGIAYKRRRNSEISTEDKPLA
jgi:hypothetical protein